VLGYHPDAHWPESYDEPYPWVAADGSGVVVTSDELRALHAAIPYGREAMAQALGVDGLKDPKAKIALHRLLVPAGLARYERRCSPPVEGGCVVESPHAALPRHWIQLGPDGRVAIRPGAIVRWEVPNGSGGKRMVGGVVVYTGEPLPIINGNDPVYRARCWLQADGVWLSNELRKLIDAWPVRSRFSSKYKRQPLARRGIIVRVPRFGPFQLHKEPKIKPSRYYCPAPKQLTVMAPPERST